MEFETFLREIRFINRYLGDSRALRKTLLREIEAFDLREFSVLDVGAGSGELLREIADFASEGGRKANLAGLDLNAISVAVIARDSADFPNIATVRGDALKLPFVDGSFDYVISSLFFHHLADEQIGTVLGEMSRVARRGIVVIDLHRHPVAYQLYKIFCTAFRISTLVREDGLLSIKRAFTPGEFRDLAAAAGLTAARIGRAVPFRLTLAASAKQQILENTEHER